MDLLYKHQLDTSDFFYYIQQLPHLQQVYAPIPGPLDKNKENIKISEIIF